MIYHPEIEIRSNLSSQELRIADPFVSFSQTSKDIYFKHAQDQLRLAASYLNFNKGYGAITEEIHKYQINVGQHSIIDSICFWLQGMFADGTWGKYYEEWMSYLLKKELIRPYENGRKRMLKELSSQEHLLTIENIRCDKQWTSSDKEHAVNCYRQFSRYLSKYTLNLIAEATDPDRSRVEHKVLKYEHFMEFVQLLPGRDALIAKLLYFGAPSIESVILLEPQAIDFNRNTIDFSGQPVSFPKHVIFSIRERLKLVKKCIENPAKYVFVNVRGNIVERTHLVNTFSRASAKMSGEIKITPSTLLKYKTEINI